MGPLIPQGFVNPDLNLFFAFVIGLGFGYVLEQAGFSSSRRLAGVFYGYDFVVLRVFFTAAVTAMTGLLLFRYLGWIEYDMLYINPTYVWSAIIGGIIMGFGFILGGFCPGTSLAGAVIGKIDAMFFIFGMFIGIFIFGEFYSVFEPIYHGHHLGNIFVFDSLGISREWFAFLLIVMAIAAFAITQRIEDSVNKLTAKANRPSLWIPAALAIFAGMLFLVLPSQPRSHPDEKDAKTIVREMVAGQHLTSIDEVAYSLLNPDEHPLTLIDVREPQDYTRFTLPGAVNIPLADILSPDYEPILNNPAKPAVFFSFSETRASEAWVLTRRDGANNAYVLEGGLNGFFKAIFIDSIQMTQFNCIEMHTKRFREKAKALLESGGAIRKQETKPSPSIKVVDLKMPAGGGC